MLLTDSFLDYLLYERNYSEGTVRYYRADILELQKFGEKLLGDLAPSDVGADLVREWIVSLMDKGYAPNTVNRKLSSVRTYYKYLLKKGLVAADPLRRVTGPKKKKPLPVFLRKIGRAKASIFRGTLPSVRRFWSVSSMRYDHGFLFDRVQPGAPPAAACTTGKCPRTLRRHRARGGPARRWSRPPRLRGRG